MRDPAYTFDGAFLPFLREPADWWTPLGITEAATQEELNDAFLDASQRSDDAAERADLARAYLRGTAAIMAREAEG